MKCTDLPNKRSLPMALLVSCSLARGCWDWREAALGWVQSSSPVFIFWFWALWWHGARASPDRWQEHRRPRHITEGHLSLCYIVTATFPLAKADRSPRPEDNQCTLLEAPQSHTAKRVEVLSYYQRDRGAENSKLDITYDCSETS